MIIGDIVVSLIDFEINKHDDKKYSSIQKGHLYKIYLIRDYHFIFYNKAGAFPQEWFISEKEYEYNKKLEKALNE